jgi:hypothetical protein
VIEEDQMPSSSALRDPGAWGSVSLAGHPASSGRHGKEAPSPDFAHCRGATGMYPCPSVFKAQD